MYVNSRFCTFKQTVADVGTSSNVKISVLFTHTCKCIYMYIYVDIYIYIYTYIYIHTLPTRKSYSGVNSRFTPLGVQSFVTSFHARE